MSDKRAADGVAHLETAAKEMIEAARAFLDVAEEVVGDPRTVEGLLSALTSLAERVTPGRADDGDSGSGLEHIDLE